MKRPALRLLSADPPNPDRALRIYLAMLAALWVIGCAEPEGTPASSSFSSPVDALVADDAGNVGFARADQVIELDFPRDHGPHDDFQTEWWYFTGHLDAENGRRFGFQWTLFRRALSPEPRQGSSDWGSRQLYMGHMALTDIDGERQFAAERFTRGAAGLAGAQAEPFRVWLEDWSAEALNGEEQTGDIWPLRLRSSHRPDVNGDGERSGGQGVGRAAEDDAPRDGFVMDITLDNLKPKVLQGDRGLSWKHENGASYYFSFTRLRASGSLILDGETFNVSGQAWFDREWSTSTLSPEQTGWDWFSLQLDDNRELMYFELRLEDGSTRTADGMWVPSTGPAMNLSREQVELDVLEHWTSPRTGGRYPSRWRLSVPELELDLEIVPLLADQELRITFSYWEGAVQVIDRADGREVGRGYVELVGYSDASP